MHRKILSNLKGQTLIETVIALAVVLILVSALISVSVASVRSATLSRNKNAAAQLAYGQSELVRNLRDDPTLYGFNWVNFTAAFAPCINSIIPTNKCYVSGSNFVSGSTADPSGVFTVSLSGPTPTAGQLTYTVSATWNDSLGAHTETVSSILTPWK